MRRTMMNVPPAPSASAAAPSNPDDRPIVASGQYNLNFFDTDNEYETFPERQREERQHRFERDFARYLELTASDAVTDADFEREFTYERLLELDSQLERKGGLSATQMRELLPPKRDLVVDCSICLEKTNPREKVVQLPCEHAFHCHCLQSWFAEHTTCPLCRHDILEGCRAAADGDNSFGDEEEEENADGGGVDVNDVY